MISEKKQSKYFYNLQIYMIISKLPRKNSIIPYQFL